MRIDPEEPEIREGGRLFARGDDWWHNAVIDIYRPSWDVYAEGYRRAADALIARLMEDRRDLNFLIFPILFLYRQYLELSLKGLIKDAEDLLGLEREAPTQHHLDRLWDCAKLLLVELLDGEARPEFAVVDNCIEQYSEVDPASQAFRYPVTTTGAPADHGLEHVNVRQLREEMTNAAWVIERAITMVSVMLDQRNEYLEEFGP